MKTIFAATVAALLLGAPNANAQLAAFRPEPVSQLHGPVACEVKGVKLHSEASCLVVSRILKGHILPFGPTLPVMDDITYVCEKGFGGFMDSRYPWEGPEALRQARNKSEEAKEREAHLWLVGYGCFKIANAKGQAQFVGPWADEVRELQLSTSTRPNTVFGTAASVRDNGRREAVNSSSFRTRNILSVPK